MKRRVIEMTIEEIYQKRNNINFPDFQRQKQLWGLKAKQELIDSILKDIDIPKLYFSKNDASGWDVIDGQQRLWAIWDFLDNEFKYLDKDKVLKTFDELDDNKKEKIRSFRLQIMEIENTNDLYLRLLFQRLQLGLPLNTGEKLNAMTGVMKDFVFHDMANHIFVKERLLAPIIPTKDKRFARETLCAQISINSFQRRENGNFARTRYEDLQQFFTDYSSLDDELKRVFDRQSIEIMQILDFMNEYFVGDITYLRKRSLVLTCYLFVETMYVEENRIFKQQMPVFVKFIKEFALALRNEASAGFDRKNRELYQFESYLNSAPGEKYQIENRHKKLIVFFKEYKDSGRI